MQDRQKKILTAIINEFIKTAEPVGSKTIMISYKFDISPATIRADMADLEKEGLLVQPHTSAGRVPTDLGYRIFVDDLVDYRVVKQQALQTLATLRKEFKKNKVKKHIYDAVSLLAQSTNNISFATLPDSKTFYLGISNILKNPEFIKDPMQASQVIEVFEKNDKFLKFLTKIKNPNQKMQIFIGKENLIEEIQSCSLIVGEYTTSEYTGFIGVMGPTRMNYPYNSVLLEEIINLLQEEINPNFYE